MSDHTEVKLILSASQVAKDSLDKLKFVSTMPELLAQFKVTFITLGFIVKH